MMMMIFRKVTFGDFFFFYFVEMMEKMSLFSLSEPPCKWSLYLPHMQIKTHCRPIVSVCPMLVFFICHLRLVCFRGLHFFFLYELFSGFTFFQLSGMCRHLFVFVVYFRKWWSFNWPWWCRKCFSGCRPNQCCWWYILQSWVPRFWWVMSTKNTPVKVHFLDDWLDFFVIHWLDFHQVNSTLFSGQSTTSARHKNSMNRKLSDGVQVVPTPLHPIEEMPITLLARSLIPRFLFFAFQWCIVCSSRCLTVICLQPSHFCFMV